MSVHPDQTAHLGSVWSGSILFACMLKSANGVNNYMQQTTLADDTFIYSFIASEGLKFLANKTWVIFLFLWYFEIIGIGSLKVSS